jgi:hypothetical protein
MDVLHLFTFETPTIIFKDSYERPEKYVPKNKEELQIILYGLGLYKKLAFEM